MKKNAIVKTMIMLLLAAVSTSTFHNYLVNGTPGTVTKTTSTLSWSSGAVQAGWNGWWFREPTQWFEFRFTGVWSASDITIDLYLPVANHEDGEFGLDGLADVVINSGKTPTITYQDVLLDNVDSTNKVYAHDDPSGSPKTHGQITGVSKNYVIGGTITVRINRHTDSNGAPHAQVGTYVPIIMTTPPTIPLNVYENNDAHKVHLFVWCHDGNGGHIVTNEGGSGNGYVALTYEEGAAVGGVGASVDKLGLLAPYIGLASTIIVVAIIVVAAATAIYVKRVKHRKEKQ